MSGQNPAAGRKFRLRLPTFSIVSRLTLTAVVTLSAAVGTSIWISVSITEGEMYRRAQDDLNINIKLLTSTLKSYGAPRREGDQFIFGKTVVNGNFEAVDRVKEIAGGTATVFMGDTRVATNVAKPDGTRAVGTKLAQGLAHDTVFKTKQTYRGEADILGQSYFTIYEPIISNGEVLGIAYVGVKKAQFFDVLKNLVNMNLVGGLAVITVAALITWFLTRRIFAPIKSLTHSLFEMTGAAREDTGVRRGNEIEEMRIAVKKLSEATEQREAAQREAAELRAQADEERRLREEERAQSAADRVSTMRERAQAMEGISNSVKQNAQQATEADQVATNACTVADRSGKIVSQAVEAMSRIEESSRKISDIISVIDEIARQTNLLALNAAVEAARAGEAGRGFAVVASEVRSLAQRSSQAAKDIKNLISSSSDRVQEGVALVNSAGSSLSEILASITRVASIVSGIAVANGEQAAELETINAELTKMVDSGEGRLAEVA
jgi:methyl-accepting chemotaxis protein